MTSAGASPIRAPVSERAQRRSEFRRIILAGSLFMLYATGIGSPATTKYFLSIGAREWHFGIIGGIPPAMLGVQFLGAFLVNRFERRKPSFVISLIAARLLYLPIAFLPSLGGRWAPEARMAMAMGLLAASAALSNYAGPFSYSWLADLIPRPVLNRFWGRRQVAMHIAWVIASVAVTAYLYATRQSAVGVFRTLVLAAVAAGVADILLFLRVREPPNLEDRSISFARSFRQPLADAEYRPFLVYSCFWNFAAMLAASFMQLYVLKTLGLAAWKTALIWCLGGIGVALASPLWGRLADRYGHRPIINACIPLKTGIVLVFMALTPDNVVWLLPTAFLLDGLLNAGTMVANNGYMLTHAPESNRSMFIAAITGLSGLAGGLGAMVGGVLLQAFGPECTAWAPGRWNAYQAVFALSLLLRLSCIPLARRIRENRAAPANRVLHEFVGDFTLRFLRFPIGLYRRFAPGANEADAER